MGANCGHGTVNNLIKKKINHPIFLKSWLNKNAVVDDGLWNSKMVLQNAHMQVNHSFNVTLTWKGDWIRKRFETPGIITLDAEEKKTVLKRLIRSTG